MHQRFVTVVALAFPLMILTLATGAACQGQQPESVAVADTDIAVSHLLQPAELAQLLRASGDKPLVLQVGSHVLFAEAHIPGALYAGAGGQDEGLQQLRGAVAHQKHDRSVVIYCGCCPWKNCPNIRPAYAMLTKLGFSNVKVLYLADDFGTNWVAKGYPVAKGR